MYLDFGVLARERFGAGQAKYKFRPFNDPDTVLAHLRVWLHLTVLSLLIWLCSAGHVLAGGSPETTLVVVNANSIESRQIANYYVALRDIPATNVVWLDGVPASPNIDIKTFRERIWKPIRTYLLEHGLDDQQRFNVVFYFGQNVDRPEPDGDSGEDT